MSADNEAELVDDLRFALDRSFVTGVSMGPPPRGSQLWLKGKVAEAADTIEQQDAKLTAIRELHQPIGGDGWCRACLQDYAPCPTVRLLDGEGII